MNPIPAEPRASERGQSLVELSISLVFMIVLLSGVADLGWSLFTLVSLHDAAKEGAAYGSICPDDPTGIQNRLLQSATDPIDLSTLPDDQINICIIDPDTGACGGTAQAGSEIEVTVSYPHDIIAPFMGAIFGSQHYTLTVTAQDTILRNSCPDHLAGTP
jgi:hypothetical protein